MYSQNNEEQYILDKFNGKTDGVFLDIGAFDGRWASNTLSLSEKGWRGICVEGSPFSFSKLFTEYKNNNNIILLNAIISSESEVSSKIVKFWESPNSAASTINDENYNKWKDRIESCGHQKFREMYVPQISFNDMINWIKPFHTTLDFVSIDVEGGSTDLAMKYNPDEFNTSLMCIEHDGRQDELIIHFAKKNFRIININSENIILGRNLK